jgi:hypothetical protein
MWEANRMDGHRADQAKSTTTDTTKKLDGMACGGNR